MENVQPPATSDPIQPPAEPTAPLAQTEAVEPATAEPPADSAASLVSSETGATATLNHDIPVAHAVGAYRDIAEPADSNAVAPTPRETAIPIERDATAPVARSEVERLPDDVVLQKSRALWREVEPVDPADPAAHTNTLQRSVEGLCVVAASRRGRSHAHDGKYREDEFAIATATGWLVVAVADGAGSKPLARVGARVASQAACAHVARALADLPPDSEQAMLGKSLRAALTGALAHALAAVSEEAAHRSAALNELASTLLLVAVSTQPAFEWVAVAQIGDGGIVAMTESQECNVLGRADHGKSAGETYFLTSGETMGTWDKRAYPYHVSERVRCLVVASDGVLDDFTPPLGELSHLFRALEPLRGHAQAEEWLLNWIGYERRGSFDDRTVVAIFPYP